MKKNHYHQILMLILMKYVIRFKEYISNIGNDREAYIHYITAWIAIIIQFPAFSSQVWIILYSLIECVDKRK